MQFSDPDVTSIIVDHWNRKSLLLFMFRIRQDVLDEFMSHLSTSLARTGTGKQGWAALFLLDSAPAPGQPTVTRRSGGSRSGMEARPWTRRAAEDDRKDSL